MNIPLEKQLVYRKVCLNNYNETFCDLVANKNVTNITQEENKIQAQSAQVRRKKRKKDTDKEKHKKIDGKLLVLLYEKA